MRVAILHDAVGAGSRPDERDAWVQAGLVEEALARRGHTCARVAADLDLGALAKALRRLAPDLAFNLVESLGGEARLIHALPALLEGLGVPFTGSGSAAVFATSHKPLAKRLLVAAGLPTPPWLELAAAGGSDPSPRRWILKPVWEDASVGIDDASLVAADPERLRGELRARRARLGRELFAEAYVEGRELNLSLLAKDAGVEVLPPAEIRFGGFPPDKPRIVGYAAKWDPRSFEYHNTPRSFAFPASDAPLLARLEALARACWGLFGLAGYARVDFRVDERGEPWILEVNANPCLSPDAGFLAAAQRAGLDAPEVVARIAAAARVGDGDSREEAGRAQRRRP